MSAGPQKRTKSVLVCVEVNVTDGAHASSICPSVTSALRYMPYTVDGFYFLMDWLHQDQPCQTKPCQTEPDLFCPFLSASLTPGTPDTSQSVPSVKYTNKKNLVPSGTICPQKFLETSGPGSQTETAIFLSGSVWLHLAPSGSV